RCGVRSVHCCPAVAVSSRCLGEPRQGLSSQAASCQKLCTRLVCTQCTPRPGSQLPSSRINRETQDKSVMAEISTTFFQNLLPELSSRAARATISKLGFSTTPLRAHLL